MADAPKNYDQMPGWMKHGETAQSIGKPEVLSEAAVGPPAQARRAEAKPPTRASRKSAPRPRRPPR
jgi:hypothetical protein